MHYPTLQSKFYLYLLVSKSCSSCREKVCIFNKIIHLKRKCSNSNNFQITPVMNNIKETNCHEKVLSMKSRVAFSSLFPICNTTFSTSSVAVGSKVVYF